MDNKKINRKIDAAAAEAKETVELFGQKIDQATQCAERTRTQVKDTVRQGVVKAADKVEEAVSAAADRLRAKAEKHR